MKILSVLRSRMLAAIGAGSALLACAQYGKRQEDSERSDASPPASAGPASANVLDASRALDVAMDDMADTPDATADVPDVAQDPPAAAPRDAFVDGTADVLVVDAHPLPPVPRPGVDEDAGPDASYPYCYGPFHEGGFWGQCCLDVYCGPRPADGCPEAPDSRALMDFGYPFTGSGDCSCGGGAQGPYQGETEDTCCYVAGLIGCTGRPLRLEDALVLAPVVRRSDWS